MIERKLVHLATAVGAAWWLVRLMFSSTERRKINEAMQALDETNALATMSREHPRGSES